MTAMVCPATREAVLEQEEYGEVDCGLCGRPAGSHSPEADQEPDGAA